jgi:hypothetical protein
LAGNKRKYDSGNNMNHPLRDKPDFIIIGAMKCATSTLHEQLATHGSFFMTTPKEPNFFSDDEVYGKGLAWYESLFHEAGTNQLRGESSTHYTKLPDYPETVERLTSFCPEVKCIYIMRHPIDRLVSHYIHEWTQGVISCDIDTAVKRYPELVEYGRYSMQIESYLNAFVPQSVLPLFVERLRDNPQRELETVFRFLEVTERPVWRDDLKSNVSAERLRACGWRDAIVRNPVVTALRRTLIPKSVRRRIRKLWTLKERPELSVQVRKKVEKVFNEDLQALGGKIDLALTCDAFKEQVTRAEAIQWNSKTRN